MCSEHLIITDCCGDYTTEHSALYQPYIISKAFCFKSTQDLLFTIHSQYHYAQERLFVK